MPSGAQFKPPPFDYPPREYALVWRLTKHGNEARCALWTHPIGAELRVTAGGELVRSEASRDVAVLLDRSIGWRAQFEAKGWTS